MDRRDQEQMEHSLETLIAQRLHGIALGYEDLNDHDELRHDPVLGARLGQACRTPLRLRRARRQIDTDPIGACTEARRPAL